MRGSELVEAMAVAIDHLMSAHEGSSALDRAIESIVGTIGRFGGKNVTSYLEAYRAEMIMRDIPEDRQLSGFPRVVKLSIHAEVLEVQPIVSLGRSSKDDSMRGTGSMTRFGD